ncbi:glycosyltransferase family 39 protein [Candidatus Gottesmanbacteria bacterium]|nr:glycosyltransferase family 39 protein [Candidatus Gottesmanbacteria bacterium]
MSIFNKRRIFLFLILICALAVRVYKVGEIPIAIYSDEASLGYNAFSLLHTGRDEFGVPHPLAFQSFGDWKTALPSYLAIPTIALLGLNGWGLRLPIALLGSIAPLVVYFLVRTLFRGDSRRIKIALVAALLISLSPWHILHSRALLFESIGLFFLLLCVFFFYRSFDSIKNLILSALFFSFSIYSYHSLRIVTPLLILFLFILYRTNFRNTIRSAVLYITAGIIFLLPFFVAVMGKSDILFGRARYISVFYDQGVKLRIEEYERQDGSTQNTRLTNLFHNKPYSYSLDILNRYFSHLNGNFLFLVGDRATPFQISNMGFLYFIDSLFLLLGLYVLARKGKEDGELLFFWLIVSIIPSAFTFLTPSSNRIFNAVFPLLTISAVGIVFLAGKQKRRLISILVVTFGYSLSFAFFLYQYFLIMPKDYASWWHYGFKELVQTLVNVEGLYDRVIISDRLGVPYIFFLYYQKYNPTKFQSEGVVDFHRDPLGFIHVENLGRFEFKRHFDWKTEKKNLWPHSLYVVRSEESPNDPPTYEIKDPEGKSIFKLYASS